MLKKSPQGLFLLEFCLAKLHEPLVQGESKGLTRLSDAALAASLRKEKAPGMAPTGLNPGPE
jgi:hypothetical protein